MGAAYVFSALTTPEGVWVGGSLSVASGASRTGAFRANAASGAVDMAFAPQLIGDRIDAQSVVLLPGGKYLVGGGFNFVNGVPRAGLVRLNADGTLDETWTTQTDNFVTEVAVLGSHVYVGGGFFSIGGQPLKGAARLDPATGAVDTTWTPNPDGYVRRMATDGTDIFLYGLYTTVGGGTRNSIAKVSGVNGALVTAFDPGLGDSCGITKAPVVYDSGFVYLAVRFCSTVNFAYSVRRYNSATGVMDATWVPVVSGTVRDLLVANGWVYLFGDFSTVAGVSRPRVARVTTANGSLDATWGGDTTAYSPRRALIAGSNLFVGGFANSGGAPTLARYTLADGVRSPGWGPPFTGSFLGTGFIYGLAASADNQKLFVAGEFLQVGPLARRGIAAFATDEDVAPDAFALGSATSVAPGSQVTSTAVSITGLTGQANVSVSGGSYSVGCTGTFVTTVGYVANGQTVCVRHAAPLALAATTNTTLTIGGVSSTFSSTTVAALVATEDFDGDGISNGVETTEGTNPFAKDNDVFANARLFAMQMYRDFLNREGDPAGITGWTDLVTAGTYNRNQVIDAFLQSSEFAGFVSPVVRLYFATYLRVPDYSGLTFNAGLVRNGTVTLQQLADFFTASPEFVALYGSVDNAGFVTLLYNNVLGRLPDPAGLSGWVALLESGYTRGQVLLGFSDSVEYQAAMANEVFVTMMYAGMLRRTPESSGFSGWVNFLDAGTYTREQVINGFFLSTEYYGRFLRLCLSSCANWRSRLRLG